MLIVISEMMVGEARVRRLEQKEPASLTLVHFISTEVTPVGLEPTTL